MIECINQSRLSGDYCDYKAYLHWSRMVYSQVFLSSAAWPPSSCTWTFPLCILVLYEELTPSCSLNWISPPCQISPPPPPLKGVWNNQAPGGGLIEDLRYTISFSDVTDSDAVFWLSTVCLSQQRRAIEDEKQRVILEERERTQKALSEITGQWKFKSWFNFSSE